MWPHPHMLSRINVVPDPLPNAKKGTNAFGKGIHMQLGTLYLRRDG